MQLVNKTTHLINKEEMVHKHLLAVREWNDVDLKAICYIVM
jgi:hypothetical protein